MKPPRTLQREQEHHKQAWEIYYGLGNKRTYHDVAKQLGLSVSAIRLMARSFNWPTRLQERDAAVARQAADNVIGSAVGNATVKRRMVEATLKKIMRAILADKVKIQVGDLDRMLRLQSFLDGDGVVFTGDTLRQRPPLEIIDAICDWMELLTPEELNVVGRRHKERAAMRPAPPTRPVPATPPPPVDSTPKEGEADD